MKKTLSLLLCSLCLPFLLIAQKGKKKDKTIAITTSINYYPNLTPYTFFNILNRQTIDQVELDFITSNSGTFVIEPGQAIIVERSTINEFPTQVLGIGLGMRIAKGDFIFHEMSLTKLSSVKSTQEVQSVYKDSVNQILGLNTVGFQQKTNHFALRYEIGRYFGNDETTTFRFAITGGIESSFYFHNRTPMSVNEYPIKATIFTFDASVSPLFSFQLGKRVFLDLKPTLFVRVGEYNSVKEQNPIISLSGQQATRDIQLLSGAFNLVMRYNIKVPSRRGRRK